MASITPSGKPAGRKPRLRVLARRACAVLLVLAAYGGLARLRRFPSHDARAYAALPEAAVVGEFADLAGAWGKTLRSPLMRCALSQAGADPDELADDPGVLWLIRLATGAKTVACVHEAPDGSGRRVLSAASYSGWRTPILRFLLATRWIPGLGRLRKSPGGARYIRLEDHEDRTRGLAVGFAIRKDVLMASLGEDPDDVLALDRRACADAPPPTAIGEIAPWDDDDPGHPYRFWITGGLPALRTPARDVAVRHVSIRVSPLWGDVVSAEVSACCEKGALRDAFGESRISGRTAKAGSLAAADASVLVLLAPGFARAWLDAWLSGGGRPATPPSDEPGEDDAALYFTRAPYGSTVLRHIPVPAATLFCPGVAVTPDRIRDVTDKTATAPAPRTTRREGNHEYMLIDWLGRRGKHMPFKLADSECGAVELPADGRGLLACTSLKCLASQRTSGASGEIPWKTWLSTHTGKGGHVAFAWIDCGAVADQCRQLAAIARLATRLGAFSPAPATRRALDVADDVLATFAGEGRVAALATLSGDDRIDVNVEIAPE